MKDVKGYVAQAGANKYGYYEISVGLGNKKFEKVSFGIKAESHTLDGIEIAKGLQFEGVVDETAHNKFVSGRVYKQEKSQTATGKPQGQAKGGYNQTGMAMGGAVNRAAQMVSSKIVKAKDAGPVALAQYIWSELCIEAADNGKVREARVALTDVDVNDYDAMAAAYKAFKAAIKAPEAQQEAPKPVAEVVKTTPQKAPERVVETPVLPEGFMGEEQGKSEEDSLPF